MLALLGVIGLISIVLAFIPTAPLEALLGGLLNATFDSSAGRAFLQNHHVIFGLIALSCAGAILLAPQIFRGIQRVVTAIEGIDPWLFLTILAACIVVSRLVLVDRMLPIVPGQDAGHYFQLANTLLDEGRYIEYASHPHEFDGFRAWRPPGYPAALALFLLLFGRWAGSVVVLNTLWMLVLTFALYAWVRAIASERHARMAAIACAFYPALLTASLQAMSEVQFAALITLSGFLLFARGGGHAWIALGGATLGLATLTRGNGLMMFPILLAAFFLYELLRAENRPSLRPSRQVLVRTGVFVLAFVLTLTPWAVRTRAVLGVWVPVATSGGYNMWLGHHPGGTGRIGVRAVEETPENEVELSRFGASRSLEYWRVDPVANVKISASTIVQILKVDQGALPVLFQPVPSDPEIDDRIRSFFASPQSVSFEERLASHFDPPDLTRRQRSVSLILLTLFNGVYYAAWLLVGIWLVSRLFGMWRPDSRPGILVLMMAAYLVTYVPFFATARFKVPAIPFLIAVASIVLVELARSDVARVRGGQHAAPAT